MVNRNAARHLLFVVSILLCFFVYMGYRLRGPKNGSSATPADNQYAAFEPTIESASTGGSIRPPTDVSVPIDDEDTNWLPPPTRDSGSLLPSGSSSSVLPLPPSGGSVAPPDSTPHSGVITGLIPSPPTESSVTDMSLDDGFATGPFDESGEGRTEGTRLALPGMPGGLTPPQERPSESPQNSFPAGAGLKLPSENGESTQYAHLPLPGGGLTPPGATAPASRPPSGTTSLPVPPPGAMSGSAPTPPTATTNPARTPAPASTAPGAGAAEWSRPEPAATGPAGAPPQSNTAATSPAQRPPSPYGPYRDLPESLRIYVVLPGDTLSSIAARELGSVSLAENIFLLNRDVIEDPDHLLSGVKIRLPVRETPFEVEAPLPPGRRPTQGLGRTHTVVRGDTLSSISMQYYGTSAGWKYLFESNKNVVPNANVLAVGTELVIPPYENRP